jgi:hypothetical protein
MKTLFTILLFTAQLVNANNNDFSTSDTTKEPMPVDKLRWSLEIKGEILILDKNGRRLLYKGDEGRSWNFGDDKPIVNNWSYRQKDLPPIALRHEWNFSPDGTLTAKIKQYDSIERGSGSEPNYGKLLKEKEMTVENFNSITWVLFQDSQNRVVAKFEPISWSIPEPSDVGRLPINSNRLTVYDTKGNLWASRIDNTDGSNVYFGATTHKGSFYISYVPFKGAREIGIVEKSRIKIEDAGVKLYIESNEQFLPRGTSAKVYGYFDLNRRSEKVNSVRSYGSDEEANFLRHISQ